VIIYIIKYMELHFENKISQPRYICHLIFTHYLQQDFFLIQKHLSDYFGTC